MKRETQNLYDLQRYKTILAYFASTEGNKSVKKKQQNVIDVMVLVYKRRQYPRILASCKVNCP